MSAYFFDASALVKRYVTERSHAWMNALCAPVAATMLLIAQTSLVEVIAA